MYSRIKDERRKLGLRQKDLAEHLFTSRCIVSSWESGRSNVPTDMVIAMARLFQCSTDYLLGVSDKRE